MARKRLYVSDVQGDVDSVSETVSHLSGRITVLTTRLSEESAFITKEHDKLLAELRELRAQVAGLVVANEDLAWHIVSLQPRPSLFRRFLSFFKA